MTEALLWVGGCIVAGIILGLVLFSQQRMLRERRRSWEEFGPTHTSMTGYTSTTIDHSATYSYSFTTTSTYYYQQVPDPETKRFRVIRVKKKIILDEEC